MSRIGRRPIPVPAEATVTVDGRRVAVKGPRGELAIELPEGITIRIDGDRAAMERADETKRTRAFHGLAASLFANMIEGVTRGYKRELELHGVGFRGAMDGRKLTMTVGYSHPVIFNAPDGIEIEVKDSKITVSGIDKQQVGNVAARIRAFCPPEPYQGKGLRYVDERVRRKAGKTVA